IEGSTRILLEDVQKQTFVAVSSMDFGGNESPLSDLRSATPLPGQPPKLMLETDRVSERRDGVVNLSATGAQRYDWDLDGDGVFELQDDASGSQQAITTQAGALRPRVRGRDTTGEAVALGSVT